MKKVVSRDLGLTIRKGVVLQHRLFSGKWQVLQFTSDGVPLSWKEHHIGCPEELVPKSKAAMIRLCEKEGIEFAHRRREAFQIAAFQSMGGAL